MSLISEENKQDVIERIRILEAEILEAVGQMSNTSDKSGESYYDWLCITHDKTVTIRNTLEEAFGKFTK